MHDAPPIDSLDELPDDLFDHETPLTDPHCYDDIVDEARSGPVDIDELLCTRFGLRSFRDGQRAIVEHVCGGGDAVVVMPTGAGKSLCYQLPAVARGGVGIVVTPLIALMKDQVDGLTARGVRAAAIHSGLSFDDRKDIFRRLRASDIELLFVAPERFEYGFTGWAKENLRVTLLAVDEAHCMSEWGHDFRPDYLKLGAVREALGAPTTVALTATATVDVQDDIARTLGIVNARRFVMGFDRTNLALAVRHTSGPTEKLRIIPTLVRQTPALIYCATRKNVDAVSARLGELGLRVARYHAGLPHDVRRAAQDGFMAGDLDIVVATNAFGMGVDKADVRTVIHYDMPRSVEAYYQEIGRAGRDGLPSRAVLLFNYADRHTQMFFIDGSHADPTDVERVWRWLCQRPGAGGPEAQRVYVSDVAAELGGGTGSDRRARACIVALRREGRVREARRDMTEDGSGFDSVWNLEVRAPEVPLVIDADRMRRLKERDVGKLDRLIHYTRAQCRRRTILSYFGERPTYHRCGNCDVCTGTIASGSAGLAREPARKVTPSKPASVRAQVAGPNEVADPPQKKRAHASADPELFDRLRRLRAALSARAQVSPFVVASNAALEAVVAARPRNAEELLAVTGFGEARVSRWGKAILGVVNSTGEDA